MKSVFFELEPSWHAVLKGELKKSYFKDIIFFLEKEIKAGEEIYPPQDQVFNAFWSTPYKNVKTVIIGQDPYHGPGQAHGLSFSVSKGVKLPPSLRNIYKELEEDTGLSMGEHGSLYSWAEQGVLLLNTALTVKKGQPNSHRDIGWERFTDAVVNVLVNGKEPLVFVLWGKAAEKKLKPVAQQLLEKHFVLKSPHPSPFSAHSGFFGSKPFSKINKQLASWGKSPVDWKIK